MGEENDDNIEETKPKFMSSLKNIRKSPIIRQIIVALGPIVITVCLGMTEGYSSILLPQLQHVNSTIKIDTQLSSLIASMSALPMAGGCILGGYAMEKIGRRAIHIWSCIPLILGWFVIAAAPNSLAILIGRFLTGVSDGLLGPPMGVYIAETSQPNVRGVLIMATCVSITVGMLLVHLLGIFLTWRVTAIISGLIPVPFAIFLFFVPESPTFLAKTKKIDAARKAFYWCRGNSKESEKELTELIERQEKLNNSPKIPFIQQMKNLSKPEFWKPTVIISVFFFTSQITGNNAVASYNIKVIKESGLSGETYNENFAMIAMDSCRLISSVISCILVNKMTRRSLMMISGYGVALLLFSLCIYLYVVSKTLFNSSTLLLTILVAYVFLIAVGLVPLSWTMMGEIFPIAFRGLGAALTSLVCFFFLYMVIHTFPHLLSLFGDIFGVFLLYGICTLCGTIFLTFFLPETKDKPLYIIEDNFKSKKPKTKSSTT